MECLFLGSTHVFAGLRAERFTLQGLGPPEPKGVHQGFAVGARVLAQGSAGRAGPLRHTLRGEDGAQERLEVGGAAHLHEGQELNHLQARGVLRLVAQDVGQGGVGVRQVSAERHRDPLARRRLSGAEAWNLGGRKHKSRGGVSSRSWIESGVRACKPALRKVTIKNVL